MYIQEKQSPFMGHKFQCKPRVRIAVYKVWRGLEKGSCSQRE